MRRGRCRVHALVSHCFSVLLITFVLQALLEQNGGNDQNPFNVHAFQIPTRTQLNSKPERQPSSRAHHTALSSSPFDDFFLLDDPFHQRRPSPPPPSSTAGSLPPGTHVHIADLQGPGLVMGRDADGQYVLQCHVAGQSMPVLVRRPAS